MVDFIPGKSYNIGGRRYQMQEMFKTKVSAEHEAKKWQDKYLTKIKKFQIENYPGKPTMYGLYIAKR